MEAKKDYDRILMWDQSLVGMQCRETSYEEVQELDLRARLLRTCVKYGGVGVAAPQIGIDLRVALINYETTTKLLINPKIIEVGEKSSEMYEGCLSLPLCGAGRAHNKTYQGGKVSRPDRIAVKYLPEAEEGCICDGILERTECRAHGVVEEFTDMLAHIVGHEVDHLDGRFYIEHLSPIVRNMVMRKYERFKRQNVVA